MTVQKSGRISVVIPAYQSAAWLHTALASVAGQSERPAQVVVVDDCSTDATSEVAAAWQSFLPLVLLRHDVNRGPGATRRTGIAACTGDLVALLDADDAWLPDHLQVLHRTWREVGGLVTARALRWAPGAGLARCDTGRRVPIPTHEEQLPAAYRENFVFPTVLFSRVDHDRAGGFAELRRSEDWDLWVRMLRSGTRVTAADHPTVLYRLSSGSLSAGHATLDTDIVLLEGWLTDADSAHRPVIAASLRRRRARRLLLASFELAAQGHPVRARTTMLAAAVTDRSLRGGPSGSNSSVALQAALGVIAWRRLQAIRSSRVQDLREAVDR